MPKTGKGASIVFGTSAVSASWTKINPGQQSLGELESSHLGTTAKKTYEPDDLSEPGECEVECWFDATKDMPALGVPETVTITLPKEVPASTAAATYAGTAFIKAVGLPENVLGILKKQTIKVKWDGKTGPAFTKEA